MTANKYHPELSENRAVWKCNNQGSIETTLIQMGRRGGDVEKCRKVERHRDVEWHGHIWRGEWVVPHPCVVDKNQEGYLRSEGS